MKVTWIHQVGSNDNCKMLTGNMRDALWEEPLADCITIGVCVWLTVLLKACVLTV